MNSKLAAVIVHDLKNALGVLEGKLQQLVDHPARDEALEAHRSCVDLRERLIAFLTLYKASSQGLAPRIEALSPEDFLQALARGQRATRPELQLQVDVFHAPPIAFFDEYLVGLALEAALQNASRFARSTIQLACSTEPDGGVCISVRDDGPGLGVQEEGRSTGVGMELCAAIANAHYKGDKRGRVNLENAAAGGALFSMHLP